MKILMLCDSMERGGAETHILTLASSLLKRGNTVDIASAGGALAEELATMGIRHFRLALGSHDPIKLLWCRLALGGIIKKGNYDVVHSHSRIASRLSRKLAKKHGAAFITTAHARFGLGGLRQRLSVWGSAPIAVSEDLKQYLVRAYSLAPENITVIPNGVDTQKFLPTYKSKKKTRILFLSRLDSDCSLGARILCRAAPELCASGEVEILIGGGGSAYRAVCELARRANEKAGFECVGCVGEVSDAADFLRSGDIFVGVSRAAIEAALCGLSVVLCGNEGYFGILGQSNFKLALNTNFCARGCGATLKDRLSADLKKLLATAEQERRESALRTRELALRYCSAERMAASTEECYAKEIRRERDAKKKTYSLLCGYYGFGNMGDELLLRAAAQRCRREFCSDFVHALTKNGKRDAERFGIICKKRSSPLGILCEIASARRVIFGGGTLLQSSSSLRSMLYYTSLAALARLFGKECLLWGSGIGRCEGRIFSLLCKLALRCCTLVEARDVRSFCLAKYFSYSERRILPVVSRGRDLAEQKRERYSDERRCEYLLHSLFKGDIPPFVVATPKATKSLEELSRLSGELARAASRGYSVLAVPMFEAEDLGVCEALASCKAISAKLLRGICFDDLVEICRRAEMVYSMRLHGLIAAKLAGTEYLALGSDVKLLEFRGDAKFDAPGTLPREYRARSGN